MSKQILVDAICGVSLSDESLGRLMQDKGLADFCGNQWNPEWKWSVTKLQSMPAEHLQRIYDCLRPTKGPQPMKKPKGNGHVRIKAMEPNTAANQSDLAENNQHPAYWAYRGWCLAKRIHYTEVWEQVTVESFLKDWNRDLPTKGSGL